MGKEKGDLTIGALASASAVAVETIRYYQSEELVAEPPRPPGGIRRYGETDVSGSNSSNQLSGLASR